MFVMPNPYDAGSARALESLGFPALATSSGACAGVLGRRDGRVSRAEALAHARLIVEAVDVPVSADLERGFGDAPGDAAETIRQAGAAGLAGGSIEDASGADVLFAPGLPDLQAVRTVCASVGKPMNFMAGIRGKSWSIPELEGAGVRRVSVATSLFRAAMSAVLAAGQEVLEDGTFGYLDRCATSPELARFLR